MWLATEKVACLSQWDQVQAAGVSLITNSSTFRKTQDASISVASLYFLATRTTFTRFFDCVRRVEFLRV
jgi:hypothetical protein